MNKTYKTGLACLTALTLATVAAFFTTGCASTDTVTDVLDDPSSRYVIAPLITQEVKKFVGDDTERGERISDVSYTIFDGIAADEYVSLEDLQTAIHEAVIAADLDQRDELRAQAIVGLVGRALRTAADGEDVDLTRTVRYIWIVDAIQEGANPSLRTAYASPGPVVHYTAEERAEIAAEGAVYGMGEAESTLLAKFAAFFLFQWLFGGN